MTITETLAEVRGHLQFADVKTKAARRTLDVPDFLAVMLAQHLAARGVDGRKPDALVFVSAGGGPLRATHFRKRVWAPAAKAASLEGQGLTFHHLRHSAVGFLIAVNAPPRVIQRRMGHSSIRVTFDVYGSVLPQGRGVRDRRSHGPVRVLPWCKCGAGRWRRLSRETAEPS